MSRGSKVEFFANSLDDFLEYLRDHEINTCTKYVCTKSPLSLKTENRVEISQDLRLHWQDDVPYYHFGTRTYECHHGKDRNINKKKRYALQKNEKAQSNHCSTKQRKMQVSKKLNCPAVIHITRVYRLPNYKIPGSVTARKKVTISSRIKKKIANNEDLEGEEGYMFNLPSAEDHQNHWLLDNPPLNINENVIETPCSDQPCTSAPIIMSSIASINGAASTTVINDELVENKTSDNLQYLKVRKYNKKLLIKKFNAKMRALQSLVPNLSERDIQKCSITLHNLFKEMSTRVETNTTGLPITNITKKGNRKRKVTGVSPQRPKKIPKQLEAHADAILQEAILNIPKDV